MNKVKTTELCTLKWGISIFKIFKWVTIRLLSGYN